MKINKDSWHYKLWKASFVDGGVPTSTDLCRYCHKVFWQLLGIVAFVSLIAVFVGGILVGLLYRCLWLHPIPTLASVGVGAIIATMVVLYNRWLNAKRNQPATDNLATSWYAARKQKVCPLVEFTE